VNGVATNSEFALSAGAITGAITFNGTGIYQITVGAYIDTQFANPFTVCYGPNVSVAGLTPLSGFGLGNPTSTVSLSSITAVVTLSTVGNVIAFRNDTGGTVTLQPTNSFSGNMLAYLSIMKVQE